MSRSKNYEILNISNYNINGINENERIRKAFNFIKDNYKKEVSLENVAKEVHMTDFQTTLGAKFKFLIFSAFIDFTFQDYKTLS